MGMLDDLKKYKSRSAELETVSEQKTQFTLLQRVSSKDFSLLSVDLFREEEQAVR